VQKLEIPNLFDFISEYESVNRFSRNHLVRPENLVHHVGVVSIICAYILNKMTEEYGQEIFKSGECCSLLMRCVTHDMEEIITGDLVRPIKYSSVEMIEVIKKLEEESISKVIERFDLPVRWEEDWRQAKSDQIGLLLKVADTLAVVMTCYREISLYSNNQFRKVAEECYEYLDTFISKIEKMRDLAFIPEQLFIYQFLIKCLLQGKGLLKPVLPNSRWILPNAT